MDFTVHMPKSIVARTTSVQWDAYSWTSRGNSEYLVVTVITRDGVMSTLGF